MGRECPECGSGMEADAKGRAPACMNCAHVGGDAAGKAGAWARGVVCADGHVLEGAVPEGDEPGGPCPECGAAVLTGCPRCGLHLDAEVCREGVESACSCCGEAFPWSAEARRARLTGAQAAVAAGAAILAGALCAIALLR